MRRAVSRPRFALTHRAGAQAALVAAVWAVVLVCATIASFAAIVSTAGYDHAFSAGVAAMDTSPEGKDRTAVTVMASDDADVEPLTAHTAVEATTNALRDAAGDYEADISTWVAGPQKLLQTDARVTGYLLDADTATANATLVSGEWPQPVSGGVEVAIPANVAELLAVGPGDTVTLGPPKDGAGNPVPVTVLTVVGVFTPNSSKEWLRDPLRGLGTHRPSAGLPEVGPFLVAAGTFATSDDPIGRLNTTLDPHIGSNASGIPRMASSVATVGHRLTEELGDSAQWVVVRSELPATYSTMHAHMQLATSLAAAVLVVVVAIALAAVALVAELLTRRRTTETTLLRDRGASSAQLGRRAATEALVIGLTAGLVAVPVAWLAYQAVAGGTWFGAAWSAGAPAVAIPAAAWWGSGLAALASAVIVVLVALRTTGKRAFARRSRTGAFARSGADVALAVIALVALVQVYTHVPKAGSLDPVLVAGPALCVLAAAALIARLLPAIARAAERIPRRSTAVALPLAGWHVARGGAMRGTFLAVASAVTLVLGVVFLGTWSQSQTDQADAEVGADVTVSQSSPPGGGAALTDSAGGILYPVSDRAIVLGTRPEGVDLFAIDSEIAMETVSGRPVGVASWDDAVSQLGSTPPLETLTVTGPNVTLTIAGTAASDNGPLAAEVRVAPLVVVQDNYGTTAVLSADGVTLDGVERTVTASPATQAEALKGEVSILAIQLRLTQLPEDDFFDTVTEHARVELTVAVDGATGGGTWDASGETQLARVVPGPVRQSDGVISASFTYSPYTVSATGSPFTIVPFEASDAVPVLVSTELAADAGLTTGDSITLNTGYATLTAVVSGTVDYVPGHVHGSALWADHVALQRALLSVGELSSANDAWWGSGLPDAAASNLAGSGFGPVQSRAERADELRDDPAQVPLRLAWILAVAAATLLALVGAAAHAAAEAQHRGLTIARLRAIGVTRREALWSHLGQHAFSVGGAVVAGLAVGLVIAAVLAPALVVSQAGGRPVPGPVLVVPWGILAAFGVGLLGLVLAAGIPASRAAVSRSTVTALRTGEVA